MTKGNDKFKVGPSSSKKVGFIFFNKSSLKMMKNAYLMLRLFSFLKYLSFCPDVFYHVG